MNWIVVEVVSVLILCFPFWQKLWFWIADNNHCSSYLIFSLSLSWVNCVYFICSYENALSCFHEHQWDGLVRGKILISLYLAESLIYLSKLYFSKPTGLLVCPFSQNHQLCASIKRAGPLSAALPNVMKSVISSFSI